MRKFLCWLMVFCLCLSVSAALAENKPATQHTIDANKAWYDNLNFSDEREKENALRGLIEAPESVIIYRDDGVVAWSWHIWVTDVDLTPIPVKNAVSTIDFLPAFLGWCEPTSEKSKNGDAYGNCVFYQWGRKDPMLGSKGSGSNTNKGYYGPNGFIDGSFKTSNLRDDLKSYIHFSKKYLFSLNQIFL